MRRRRLPNGRADDDRAGVVDNHDNNDNLATAP
jgi:hypothetical protein